MGNPDEAVPRNELENRSGRRVGSPGDSQPGYRPALNDRIRFLCECLAAADRAGSPALLYVSSWQDRDKIIGYEYVSEHFRQLMDCPSDAVANRFRGSILERRIYRYHESDRTVAQETWVPQDLPAVQDQLRNEGQQTGWIEAVYKIRDPRGDIRWLKDLAKIEYHAADGVTLSVGQLTEITKEMEAEAQVKRAEAALQEANRELERLANLDGLTQLANRRHFDHCLEREWMRLYRERGPIALILADVDQFKAYNDNYGHQAGDDCLRRIAQVITEHAGRPADLAARYGGEEFALILPNTSASGAHHLAETLRGAVMALEIAHRGSSVAKVVTLSVGVTAARPHSPMTPADLIAQADAALYNAKQGGRNQVMDFPSTVDGSRPLIQGTCHAVTENPRRSAFGRTM